MHAPVSYPVTLALALALALAPAPIRAQPREGGRHAQPESVSAAPAVVHHLVVAPGDPVDTLDSTVAPALVFTPDGALLITRDHGATLTLSVLDTALHRVGDRRVLCTPSGAFAVAPGPPGRDGAAALYVDHDREVVLAILGPSGEARNVPRMLVRADLPVGSVALVPTEGGWTAAWATTDASVTVIWLDALGVPRVPPHRVIDGGTPRLSWLSEARETVLVVDPAGATQEPTALWFNSAGELTNRARWPAGALGPIETTGGTATVQLTASGAPALVRIGLGGPSPLDAVAPGAMSVTAAVSVGSSVAALVTDARGQRQSVACLAGDGPGAVMVAATALVRSGASTPASVAVRGDGEVFAVAREAVGHAAPRLGAAQVTCRRE